MKLKLLAAGAVALAIIGWPNVSAEAPETPDPEPPKRVEIEVTVAKVAEASEPEPPTAYSKVEVIEQTIDREEWLARLIQCESGGDPNALNPVDLDGTPSHGILQFKDTTFEMYRLRYDMGAVALYDAEAQKQMVRFMMDDPRVRWENEFPDCVRKHGRPPAR